MLNKFPILAWPVKGFDEKQIDEVKLWKEIGLTVNICDDGWNENETNKDAFIRLLDECHKHDIKVIIQDKRLLWKGASEDPEAYREKFNAVYKDFGKHPATLGFFIGDEPWKKDMEDVITAFRIQREQAPELLPFLNLLPLWDESNSPYMGFETQENYLSFMKERYNAPVLSYDRYNQMRGTEEGIHTYFHDMRIYNELAQTLGIPLWTCLLAIGHWDYAVPDEGAVRWQFNTALAGGCTGIIWFTLDDIPFATNTHGAAIDIFGEKTPHFYKFKSVSRYFLASTADIFKDLRLDECYHVGRSWGGYPLFKKGISDIILDVRSLKNTDMIVSFFTSANGDKYVAVVNNSTTVNDNNFNITFNRKKCDPYEIKGYGNSWRVYDVYPNNDSHNFDPRRENNAELCDKDRYTINLWAAAGQMYLFKI